MSSTSAPINLANFGTGVSYDGGAGNDSIIGSKGDDVIRGGLGADRVQGKVGNDTFVFVAGDLVGSLGENNGQNGSVDHILDFQGAGTNSKAGYQDKIAFYGYSADAYLRFDRYSTERVQSGTNPDGSPKYVIKTDTKLQYYQIVDPADESKNGFILVQMADGSDQLNVSKTSSDVVFYQDAVIGTSTGAVTEAGGTKNGTPGIATASGKLTATFDQTAGFKQPDAAALKGSYGSFVFNSDGTWSYALDNAKPETQGLRAGDTKTETLLVETVDGARATISVTVRGANDVAVITGTSTGAAREDAVLTAKGKLTVSDVDVGESSFEARGADNPIKGTYGSLTIDAAGNWVYTLDNVSAAVQALKGSETRKESFTVKTMDGTLAKISLSVKGTNDVAVITGTSSGSVTEDTTLTTTGKLTVSDVDAGEGSFVAHGADNPVKGTYGKLTIDAAGNWVYALDNASTAVQALRAGETRADSIVIKTVDGTQAKISVTVTGTNEAAVIAGTNSGSVTEDTTLTTTGKLTVSDVDAGSSSQTAGFKQPEPSALKGQYGSFTFATDGTWSYALDNANAATQALKAGDTRTETLVVKTLDDTPATITVTVNGADDKAIIAGMDTGTVKEDTTLTSSGTLTVTDVDAGQSSFVAHGTADALKGSYGSLTIDAAGSWVYTLDNANAAVQALKTGEAKTDTITVSSVDGTTHTIAITVNGTDEISKTIAPIELSAIAQGQGGFKIKGEARGDYAGHSVSSAGDIDGDGKDDLIVGAIYNDSNGLRDSGAAYVVFGKEGLGSSGSIELTAIAQGQGGFKINGEARGDYAGHSVSSAGDIDGDGKDDLIVGAPSTDSDGLSDNGAAYVVFGKEGLGSSGSIELTAIAQGQGGFKINGEAQGDHAGYSVSSAGDVNGDGKDDLIVGAYLNTSNGLSNSGAAYVVFGKEGLGSSGSIELTAIAQGQGGFKINGEASDDLAGLSVSSAGDVNGDGKDDLIVGAYGNDSNGLSDNGAAYVVFGKEGLGSSGSIELTAIAQGQGGFKIKGEAERDFAGYSVSSAGDVNGDGKDDLIVSAPINDSDGRQDNGAAYVVFGKEGLGSSGSIELTAIAQGQGGFKIKGEATFDYAGYSVSSAGDVNGDGKDDLIVSAVLNDSNGLSDSGAAYVVFGKEGLGSSGSIELTAIAQGQGGFKINGEAESDFAGYSVSSAGDVNHDGVADVIVSAVLNDSNGQTDNGAAYVVFGDRDWFA